MKNKYIYRSRISEKKFRQILKLFCMDIEAKKVAELTNVNRMTINRIFNRTRIRMAQDCQLSGPFESGEIELDESYFGPKRQRGKRGRGAGNKTIVFGILKREGKIFTQIIKNCSHSEIMPIIERMIKRDCTIYTDGWPVYDALVDFGYKKHYKVRHSQNEFANGTNHINGIESFWSFCKNRIAKFHGIRKDKFLLHLKESEFRHNHRDILYVSLLKLIKNNPL